MQIFSMFQKHRRYAILATAYADDELMGADRSRFEAHLSSCSGCAAQVEAAQRIKAVVSSLPTVPVGRSFALTPAMVAVARPQMSRPTAMPRVPVYLALTRVAAGLAVVAFVSVFAFSLLDESTSGDHAAAERLSSGVGEPLADTIGAGAESSTNAADKSAATPVQALAPASGGAVEGQSFPSPSAAGTVPAGRNSADSQVPGGDDSGTIPPAGQPEAVGDTAFDATAYSTAADSTADGGFPWAIALGSLAGALVGFLYVMEIRRRKRV